MMKRFISMMIIVFIISTMFTSISFADNPAISTETAGGGMAAGKPKWVGNIWYSGTEPDYFSDYWNQLTPENASKWASCEAQQGVYNFSAAKAMYDYTRSKGIPFKFHTLVWGSQYPRWMDNLSPEDQKIKVESWIKNAGLNFPDAEYVDVVNEPMPGHAPPRWRTAIGGDIDLYGTGWDWVVWSFEKAREYFPNSKLFINDYNILSGYTNLDTYINVINILKERGLIDGIGCQGHGLENTSAADVKARLDRLAATGLPIHISEFDLNIADDTAQKNKMQELFPVFYEHPAVEGITLWGYLQGHTWIANSYLIRSDGTERPALVWLKEYLASIPPVETPSVTGVTLNKSTLSLTVGASEQLVATVEPTDAANKEVIWESDNTGVATVDATGKVTAIAAGTATIMVTTVDGGKTATCTVTVSALGNPYTRNEAEAYDQQSGVQKETCSEGGQNIGYIENGDWIRFNNMDFGTGAASFEARVSSQGSGGNIEIRLDSLTGPVIGNCTVPVTGGWQTWTTVSCPVSGATGVHDLYLKFTGGSGYLFNINWWQFNPAGPGVYLNRTSVLLRAGETDTLTATVYPLDEPDKTVIFSSNNPQISVPSGAVYDPETGATSVTINALAKGTATITAATKDGKTATCTVTVIPANELIVNGGFENGINPWIGNDSATISLSNQDPYSGSNCLFTTGRTTTGGGPRQNLIFEVIPGHTYQVSAKVKYVGDAYPASKQFNFCITCDTERSDYWSSIRIMASANITKGTWGTISGTYQIAADEKISNPYIFIETVYASSPSATEDLMDFYVDDISLVDITAPPYVAVEGVTLDADTLNLKEGESRQLVATVVPENATNKNVIWESDNTGVATVDSTGKVTAVAAGTATIMVTTVDGSKTAACTVTVTPEAEVPTAALTASGSVQPGATFTAGISLDNLSSGVYAEDILLSYDADVFEYVGTTGANDNIKVLREDASAPGTVRLIAANIGGVSGASTPVLNVSFKVKAGVENTTGSIAVTSAKLGVPDGSIIEAGLSSKVITIGGGTPGVDKSQLITAINNAQTLYDNAEVGTEPGQYPQAARDALKAAIDAAKAVRDDSSATQSQVDSAVTALNNAVNIFKAAVVEEAKPDINDDGIIDVADLGFVAYYYGKECTGTEWQIAKAADMNGDGKIGIEDLAYVAIRIED